MRVLLSLATRIWKVFVDDGRVLAAMLAWIGLAGVVLPYLALGEWSGPVLFAGIATITFISLKPRP